MKKVVTDLFMVSVLLLVGAALGSCTQQQRVKNFGGKMTITLPANQKLVTATWKDTQLWYLTKPMRVEDVAETYQLTESSSMGLLEGAVTFVESK